MLLQFDGTIIVIAISFIVFAVIMHNIFYVPMRRVIEERDDYIKAHLGEAKDLNNKAQELVDDYQQKINVARKKANTAIESHTQKGKEQKSQILTTATSQAHNEVEQAKAVINSEKDAAIDVLKNDVAPLAQQIISKVLGQPVSISGIDQQKVEKILRG